MMTLMILVSHNDKFKDNFIGVLGIIYKPTTFIGSIVGSVLPRHGKLATAPSTKVSRERAERSPAGSSRSPGTTSPSRVGESEHEGRKQKNDPSKEDKDNANEAVENSREQSGAGISGDLKREGTKTHPEETGLENACRRNDLEEAGADEGVDSRAGGGDESGTEGPRDKSGTEGPRDDSGGSGDESGGSGDESGTAETAAKINEIHEPDQERAVRCVRDGRPSNGARTPECRHDATPASPSTPTSPSNSHDRDKENKSSAANCKSKVDQPPSKTAILGNRSGNANANSSPRTKSGEARGSIEPESNSWAREETCSNTNSSNTKTGNPETGNPETGNTETGNTETIKDSDPKSMETPKDAHSHCEKKGQSQASKLMAPKKLFKKGSSSVRSTPATPTKDESSLMLQLSFTPNTQKTLNESIDETVKIFENIDIDENDMSPDSLALHKTLGQKEKRTCARVLDLITPKVSSFPLYTEQGFL